VRWSPATVVSSTTCSSPESVRACTVKVMSESDGLKTEMKSSIDGSCEAVATTTSVDRRGTPRVRSTPGRDESGAPPVRRSATTGTRFRVRSTVPWAMVSSPRRSRSCWSSTTAKLRGDTLSSKGSMVMLSSSGWISRLTSARVSVGL
jgi:hypothetical protein